MVQLIELENKPKRGGPTITSGQLELSPYILETIPQTPPTPTMPSYYISQVNTKFGFDFNFK